MLRLQTKWYLQKLQLIMLIQIENIILQTCELPLMRLSCKSSLKIPHPSRSLIDGRKRIRIYLLGNTLFHAHNTALTTDNIRKPATFCRLRRSHAVLLWSVVPSETSDDLPDLPIYLWNVFSNAVVPDWPLRDTGIKGPCENQTCSHRLLGEELSLTQRSFTSRFMQATWSWPWSNLP